MVLTVRLLTMAGDSKVSSTKGPKEEDVFDLQIGIDDSEISFEDKHFFDIVAYLVLDDLLTPAQVDEAREVEFVGQGRISDLTRGLLRWERVNIIENGGVVEDAIALPQVIPYIQAFIWGRQCRLVGSRAILREAGRHSRLTQGGDADARCYARYRCAGDGQFRCLLITCLIALHDTSAGDGSFCLVPGSHKASLSHRYEQRDLDEIARLREIPLRAGSGISFTESLSYAFKPPTGQRQNWLSYQYGSSYMMNWPGCEPSADLLARTRHDLLKSHLLLKPYYHPTSSQGRKGDSL